MSTESNAIPQSAVASGAGSYNEISVARRFYWSVKREPGRAVPFTLRHSRLPEASSCTISAAKMRATPGMTTLERGEILAQTFGDGPDGDHAGRCNFLLSRCAAWRKARSQHPFLEITAGI